MKVNVTKKIVTIDDRKLIEYINNYEKRTNQKAYLFMNKDTMYAFQINKLENSQPHIPTACIVGILCDLEGRKIFEDENLEFGEVEIR